jgi:hypothetical protein
MNMDIIIFSSLESAAVTVILIGTALIIMIKISITLIIALIMMTITLIMMTITLPMMTITLIMMIITCIDDRSTNIVNNNHCVGCQECGEREFFAL